ncbi:hypothetical protein F2Q65_04730 [Thiohalocapsa marina]|uniref:AB hydrolase-1 domain-containing protein n=1 Tax=Thiohalocapsa marina TaxID=424902 RepID=A0A5M8FPI1_9GAMM|nr:hypothetical protein [Thiohalocapsa marina]KAA6186679.1 hypothetical protein F2Q65_04730 [Thiohalocapsa marina]
MPQPEHCPRPLPRGYIRAFLLSALIVPLGACQTVPPPAARATSAERIERSLNVLGSAQSTEAETQRALARYQRNLRRVLPAAAAGEAEPGIEWAATNAPDWREPQDLASIRLVKYQPETASGLQRSGLGVPAVGHIVPGGANAPIGGFHVPMTALALPGNQQGQPELALANPLRVESIDLGERAYPVAMDLSAPFDATRSMGPSPFDGLRYLLRADRFAGQSRLSFLQPFEPDKRPLVLVHGLMTTPRMWDGLVRELMADAVIRDHYQIWFFFYPTAQPVPLSALQLREALDAASRAHALDQPIVLVGYSMGGVLSRAQVTGLDPSDAERVLPGVSQLPSHSPVARALIFEPRSDVSRVVFMFTPHRGSHLATFSLAVWFSRLIRLPNWIRMELSAAMDSLAGPAGYGRFPTSIQGLSPESPFLQALDQAALSVPAHSVIGNRGRRGELSRSSDGVVPYFSAHLPAAESERVVPTDHGGISHPDAVDELKRILRLELEPPPEPPGAPGKG